MRYAYAVTTALLMTGAAVALVNDNPVTAQTGLAVSEQVNLAPGGAPSSFADLAAQLQPAVVNIATRQKVQVATSFNPLTGERRPVTQDQASGGSGFLISSDGYIVTNNHVIEGATKVDISLDNNKRYEATIIGTDPTTDLALLKIEDNNLPFVKFGDSDQTKIGEWVLAVGNPFDLNSTVTAGIISAKARNINMPSDWRGQMYRKFEVDFSFDSLAPDMPIEYFVRGDDYVWMQTGNFADFPVLSRDYYDCYNVYIGGISSPDDSAWYRGDFYENVFRYSFYNNYFIGGVKRNVTLGSCHSNTITSWEFAFNSIAASFQNNRIFGRFIGSIVAESCVYNTLYSDGGIKTNQNFRFNTIEGMNTGFDFTSASLVHNNGNVTIVKSAGDNYYSVMINDSGVQVISGATS